MRLEVQRFIENVVLTWDSNECLPWPFYRNRGGYGRFRHNGVKVIASRYVCELVWGAPQGDSTEAAHTCGSGDAGCVNPLHLVWKSLQENQDDRKTHGTTNTGRRNGRAILTEIDVAYIRSMRGVMTQKALGDMFGVAPRTIGNIQLRRIWGFV